MNIKEYFKDYSDKFKAMKKALKKWIDAKTEFCELSGFNLDFMPKGEKIPHGLDYLLAGIETLEENYKKSKKECEDEREKCLKDIEKLDNNLYELLIEYFYLDEEKNNKKILIWLKEYHDIEISYSHLRNSKTRAIKEFEKIINEKIVQKSTK